MGGNLVAVGLLLTMGVTLSVLIRYARRPFRRGWPVMLLGIIVWAILISLLFPMLVRGQDVLPLQVLVIPSFCGILAVITSTPSLRAYLGLLTFTLIMLIAILWYSAVLVDSGNYTGSSYVHSHMRSSTPDYLIDLAATDTKSYPAGWLRDMPFAHEIPERVFTGYRFVPHPLWHTRLTGLYRRETIHGEVWYPGGKLADAWHKLEIRPRPSSLK